jgi:hypothetical protein
LHQGFWCMVFVESAAGWNDLSFGFCSPGVRRFLLSRRRLERLK